MSQEKTPDPFVYTFGKCVDCVVDLGLGGGESGGHIVAQGPPEKIVNTSKSLTGKYLKPLLGPQT